MASTVLRSLATAVALLTIVPVPPSAVNDGALAPSVKWFPLVGALAGAAVAAVGWLGLTVAGWEPWAAAIADGPRSAGFGIGQVIVGVLMVVANFVGTRGMHWDGLADVSDAWWGGFSKPRRLEIMSDSSLGTFGVFALMVAFAALVLAYSASLHALWVLPVAACIGRMSAVFGAQLGKPAKDYGLGALAVVTSSGGPEPLRSRLGDPSTWAVALGTTAIVSIAGGACAGALGPPFAIGLAVAFMAAATFPHVLSQRMGGVTGDVLGASILLTEIVSVGVLVLVA